MTVYVEYIRGDTARDQVHLHVERVDWDKERRLVHIYMSSGESISYNLKRVISVKLVNQ